MEQRAPRGPSKQAALATALFVARVARLAWKAGGRPSHDGVTESEDRPGSKHRGETTMDHYAGIDVSLECSSVCVVDASGKIVREAEPEADRLVRFARTWAGQDRT